MKKIAILFGILFLVSCGSSNQTEEVQVTDTTTVAAPESVDTETVVAPDTVVVSDTLR